MEKVTLEAFNQRVGVFFSVDDGIEYVLEGQVRHSEKKGHWP